MKTLIALIVAAVSVFAVGVSSAQSHVMAQGAAEGIDWMGGYDGMAGMLFLLTVVAGFVAAVRQARFEE